jgi:hypothetical protein
LTGTLTSPNEIEPLQIGLGIVPPSRSHLRLPNRGQNSSG